MWRETVILSLAVLGTIGLGCSSRTDNKSTQQFDCGIPVDRFKELMIVDDGVITDARSRNATNGPWSFRHAIEATMADGASQSDFILSWFDDWATTTQVNGFQTDVEPRAAQIKARLVCPWLLQTPANGCDPSCTQCASRELDLAKAPFRLVAIVNRTDLRKRPDATSPAGEARLIFAMTRGPADDPSSAVAPMTVIFEYALPDIRTPKGWVDAWHHLSTHNAFDENYNSELESLTEQFVARGASPSRTNGSALSQVRTNESEFNWIWQLREFRLTSAGDMRLAPVSNTPGESLNKSDVLRDFVMQNQDKILNDQGVLPTSLRAGSADQFRFRWDIPGIDEQTRSAFARATCNGCHSGENPPIDVAFHVSPFKSGVQKLSPFVNNPQDPSSDELARRENLMKELLCQK